ncbi:MAG: hypothetical protein WCK18_10015 [Prolixibacteraceae bacterium]
MKKLILSIFLISVTAFSIRSQVKLDDFGRIALNTYLPEQINLTTEARNLLETKLSQIGTTYGMSSSEISPRFIITATINIGTKDIISGPPQLIAQNIEVTFFIGDAIENRKFGNTIIKLKGVGTNENKAFIDAIKRINPKNHEVAQFVEDAKAKIITYYITKCDFILKESHSLKLSGKYDEAIYKLSIVPNVCQVCYFRCLDTLAIIYQLKINEEGKTKLLEAKTVWANYLDKEGAKKVSELIRQISPGASCQNEVNSFIKSVTAKLESDAKSQWEFEMKQYDDQVAREKENLRMQDIQATRNFELDKIRTKAYSEIAIEYAKNQPRTIYNNINWR